MSQPDERALTVPPADGAEWLEADGLGGFASGTATGIRTRRYHGLLLAATAPPTGRMMLVNGVEAWVEIDGRRVALTSHRYAPNVVYPDGSSRLAAFSPNPWPTWRFEIADGCSVTQEIFSLHGRAATVVTWTLMGGAGAARLFVRPLLSGRDYHALHRENPAFNFEPLTSGRLNSVAWTPYPDVPTISSLSNGTYRHAPLWYRNFHYAEEQARGLDHVEDLASPGEWSWTLSDGRPAVCVFSADSAAPALAGSDDIDAVVHALRDEEAARRAAFPSRLDRSADAYLVRRGTGRTLVAGYPWFTDWGRDTFIAIRGIALATGRVSEARDILLEWSDAISGGMIPNRFPDTGVEPEFNSVDGSLWFVVAAFELERAVGRRTRLLPATVRTRLQQAVDLILLAYCEGTRFGIRRDADGLLAAGTPGVALTWMDALVNGTAVTARCGKPVEVNALWLNALRIAARRTPQWRPLYRQGHASFAARFWNDDAGGLYDVIDVDHRHGAVDTSVRPNQILAVGGLPFPVVGQANARRIVDGVERQLLTPLGLRTLAPQSRDYTPRYDGGPYARDAAYHQGTVWPWLIGPFVEAWLRVHGNSPANRAIARRRFLEPLLGHLDVAGLGHVSEIADAEPPFTPRGCPFQAWSMGEVIRLDRQVLG